MVRCSYGCSAKPPTPDVEPNADSHPNAGPTQFSPIMAQFTQSRRTYSSFLTGLCAIVGGVVALAGEEKGGLWSGGRR